MQKGCIDECKVKNQELQALGRQRPFLGRNQDGTFQEERARVQVELVSCAGEEGMAEADSGTWTPSETLCAGQ